MSQLKQPPLPTTAVDPVQPSSTLHCSLQGSQLLPLTYSPTGHCAKHRRWLREEETEGGTSRFLQDVQSYWDCSGRERRDYVYTRQELQVS